MGTCDSDKKIFVNLVQKFNSGISRLSVHMFTLSFQISPEDENNRCVKSLRVGSCAELDAWIDHVSKVLN